MWCTVAELTGCVGMPGTERGCRKYMDNLVAKYPDIRLHSSQVTLIEQLRHFPKADHDDGPDALHMLWALCNSFGSRDGFRSIPRRPDSHNDDDENRHSGQSRSRSRFGNGGW